MKGMLSLFWFAFLTKYYCTQILVQYCTYFHSSVKWVGIMYFWNATALNFGKSVSEAVMTTIQSFEIVRKHCIQLMVRRVERSTLHCTYGPACSGCVR